MGKVYHINKHGVPAICRAKKRCPLGGSENHFDNIKDAQIAADKQNESEFGLLNKINPILNEATTDKDFKKIKRRMDSFKEYEMKKEIKTYYSRSKSSERLKNYAPGSEESRHYTEERKERENIIKKHIREGNVTAYYKVNHEVDGVFKDQIFQVNDTGQVRIFDATDGRLITTFIPRKNRMEIMMLRAGDIPDRNWLREVEENRRVFDREWEKVEHKYNEKRESDKFERDTIINYKMSKDNKRKQRKPKKQPVQYNKNGIPINR